MSQTGKDIILYRPSIRGERGVVVKALASDARDSRFNSHLVYNFIGILSLGKYYCLTSIE